MLKIIILKLVVLSDCGFGLRIQWLFNSPDFSITY